MPRRLLKWAAVLAGLLGSSMDQAQAARLPLAVGAQLGYRTLHELRIIGEAQWALTDVLALRVRGGPGFLQGPVRGTALVGPVVGLDVLTWVPSLYVLAGVAGPHWRSAVQLGVEAQRYVSMRQALVVGVNVELQGRHDVAALMTLGGRFSL